MTKRKGTKHVIIANHRPTCSHCGEWIEMPLGNVDWFSGVLKAFGKAHEHCAVGDYGKRDEPLCLWQEHPGGARYVRLLADVRSEMSGATAVAPAGVYEAHMNPLGAVHVVTPDGQELGVKPGEFVFCGAP